MGWAARTNPRINETVRMARARELVTRLGRAKVEAVLDQMPDADQVIVQGLLDELCPRTFDDDFPLRDDAFDGPLTSQ